MYCRWINYSVRVYDQPSPSVEEFACSIGLLLSELDPEGARRKDIHGSWSSVLDDKSGVLRFGNDPGEAGEVVENSFWIRGRIL